MTDIESLVALGEGITPGPWLVDADDSYSIIAYPEGVATCVADTDPPHLRTVADDGEAMANARAIAAAPDLIAAIRTLQTEKVELRAEVERLDRLINTPETSDFMLGIPLEAAHQRERWGSDHDGGKSAFDWFWLVGYLAQKAASAQVSGDHEKALHHTISTAAALANWHLAITGADNTMRPGIEPPRHALSNTGEME